MTDKNQQPKCKVCGKPYKSIDYGYDLRGVRQDKYEPICDCQQPAEPNRELVKTFEHFVLARVGSITTDEEFVKRCRWLIEHAATRIRRDKDTLDAYRTQTIRYHARIAELERALEEAETDFYYIHQHSEDAHGDSYEFMTKAKAAFGEEQE